MKNLCPCLALCFTASLFCTSFLLAGGSPVPAPARVEISVSSDHEGYEAFRACDGNPETFWHTRFGKNSAQGPHWIELDLQSPQTLHGLEFLPRPDMVNGTMERVEIRVYDSREEQREPVWSGSVFSEYSKPVKPVRIDFAQPATGRFLRVTVLSALENQPYASVAELRPVVPGKTFLEKSVSVPYVNPNADPELVSQFNSLQTDIQNRARYEKIQNQLYDRQAAILPGDRTPADVVFRRTMAAAQARLKADSASQQAREFLNQLEALKPEAERARLGQLNEDEQFALFKKTAKIRRQILFSSPELNFDRILFLKRHRGTYSHMCDQFYGRTLLPGGGVFLLENAFSDHQTVKNVLENAVTQSGRLKGQKLDSGSFETLALNYEADQIAFAYTECTGPRNHIEHSDLTRGHWDRGRCLHVFTANLDGSGLRQLTDGTWNDFYPCFLPNGRIAFVSERRGGYLRCGRECPNFTIFDMNPDGSRMRCLSYHETNEWAPSVSNDGKILWTRWDYIDRESMACHNPWVMSLNGSDPRQIIGNYTSRRLRPDMEVDLRAIPASSRLVATASPHHGHNYGSLVVIDPAESPKEELDPMAAIKRLTPDVDFPESQNGIQIWGFPFPVSENLFLAVADYSVTFNEGREWNPPLKGRYGIYLLDRFGNRELVFRDPEIGCSMPIPVVRREKPVVMPELVQPGTIPSQEFVALPPRDWRERPMATVTLANVYQSLKPLPANTKITALRVVQIYPCSVPTGKWPHIGYMEPTFHEGTHQSSAVNLVRGVVGTVPVEADGSANFQVPAQVELFFQALDEQGRAVQSMRSGTYFQPGDQVSCVGCHEPLGQITRASAGLPTAFKREASVPVPAIPGAFPANFPELIQPILDAKCVECHAKPESKTFSLAREPYVTHLGRPFYQSYENLMKNDFGFYNYGNPVRTIPGEFGARKARLLPLLDAGHYGVKLTQEERERFILWLDMLSPFYSVYEADLQEKQLKGEAVYPTLE